LAKFVFKLLTTQQKKLGWKLPPFYSIHVIEAFLAKNCMPLARQSSLLFPFGTLLLLILKITLKERRF